MASQLGGACGWLLTNGVLPTDVVTRHRRIAEGALRAWWSMRSLRAIRWLVEHGFDPAPEVALLTSQL